MSGRCGARRIRRSSNSSARRISKRVPKARLASISATTFWGQRCTAWSNNWSDSSKRLAIHNARACCNSGTSGPRPGMTTGDEAANRRLAFGRLAISRLALAAAAQPRVEFGEPGGGTDLIEALADGVAGELLSGDQTLHD